MKTLNLPPETSHYGYKQPTASWHTIPKYIRYNSETKYSKKTFLKKNISRYLKAREKVVV